jgi:hypothetical protein
MGQRTIGEGGPSPIVRALKRRAIVPQPCGAVRGGSRRQEDTDEGNGLMTPPRKTRPGTSRGSRPLRGRTAPVARTCTAIDDALIAASGIDAHAILIVARDQAGALRLWSASGDVLEALRLAEYARGELTVRALHEPSST